ncbi:MAG TPA: sulfatase/phosphatase domain-containing protein, partial [Tepidisphaeraceae bacterium]|nr:sulfatase/phosphatase domain-containing protein [Tepidisphaeraceae bacterium]
TVEFPSIAELIKGTGKTGKHDAIFSYMSWDIPPYRSCQRTIRTESHKMILYPLAGVTQLFDLDKDPWEIHNVVDQSKYAAIKTTLRKNLVQLQRELGDNLVLPNV